MSIRVDLSAREHDELRKLTMQFDMTPSDVMRAALRLYQMVSICERRGARMAFVDAEGRLIKEDEPVGCPALE